MKNNIIKIIGACAIASSTIIFAACGNAQTADTPVNDASASMQISQVVTQNKLSLDEAIDIALNEAGIERAEASFLKTELDASDAVQVYEIEFTADGVEYDYEIAVSDGKILKSEKEKAESISEEKTSQPSKEETTSKSQSNGYIGIDSAKSAALNDAGIKESDAVFVKAEFDSDDLIPSYDIEFVSGGYEYDYEINAKSGEVIEKSKEREITAKSNSVTDNFITEEEAKNIAFEKSGIKETEAKNIEVSLDIDDIIPSYDVEFINGNYEYEYEINAKTGKIIAASKELKD